MACSLVISNLSICLLRLLRLVVTDLNLGILTRTLLTAAMLGKAVLLGTTRAARAKGLIAHLNIAITLHNAITLFLVYCYG